MFCALIILMMPLNAVQTWILRSLWMLRTKAGLLVCSCWCNGYPEIVRARNGNSRSFSPLWAPKVCTIRFTHRTMLASPSDASPFGCRETAGLGAVCPVIITAYLRKKWRFCWDRQGLSSDTKRRISSLFVGDYSNNNILALTSTSAGTIYGIFMSFPW